MIPLPCLSLLRHETTMFILGLTLLKINVHIKHYFFRPVTKGHLSLSILLNTLQRWWAFVFLRFTGGSNSLSMQPKKEREKEKYSNIFLKFLMFTVNTKCWNNVWQPQAIILAFMTDNWASGLSGLSFSGVPRGGKIEHHRTQWSPLFLRGGGGGENNFSMFGILLGSTTAVNWNVYPLHCNTKMEQKQVPGSTTEDMFKDDPFCMRRVWLKGSMVWMKKEASALERASPRWQLAKNFSWSLLGLCCPARLLEDMFVLPPEKKVMQLWRL